MLEKKLSLALLFFLLLLPPSVYALQSTGTDNTATQETQSNLSEPDTYSDLTNSSSENSNKQDSPLLNLSNPWEELRKLIDSGMQGLRESNNALSRLETQLETLKAETQWQKQLLEESRRLVISLKQNLEDARNSVDVAIDRMKDAEEYAVAIEAQNELLRKETAQFQKSAIIGFSFGGISLGAGVPLIVEGVRSDNRTMALAGVCFVGVGSLVWVTGHLLFKVW